MGTIFAMSDIHGEMTAFQNALRVVNLDDPDTKLILLGDYIDHSHEHIEIYPFIANLQKKYPGQVVALIGNNDADLHNIATNFGERKITDTSDPMNRVVRWIGNLPAYYKTDTQIFVHAGIDESIGDLWEWGCERDYFYEKFPPATGSFRFDVIAGHVGTYSAKLSNDPNFHDVFWDGESHYYIDGSSELTHYIPVLKYDEEQRWYTTFKFEELENAGDWEEIPVLPYSRHP